MSSPRLLFPPMLYGLKNPHLLEALLGVEKIENLIKNDAIQYIGYKDNKSVILDLNQVFGFTVESNKIYAITENDKLQLKSRLYQLENDLPQNFIKINQHMILLLDIIQR